jgi:hypothetical protein
VKGGNETGVGPRHVLVAGLSLRVDAVTAEVVTAMRNAGVRPLLLKGPSTQAWLYRDHALRPYIDTDLLVAPDRYRSAGAVLRGLGFHPMSYSQQGHLDSQTWIRDRDSSYVDLHRSVMGVSAPPAEVWRELSANVDTLRVAGVEVETLAVQGRALHMALHAAQHSDARSNHRLRDDLARALRVTGDDVWRRAAELARALDASPAFAAGLRLDPAGVRLAQRLGLPASTPPLVTVKSGPEVAAAVAIEHLLSERSLRRRAWFLLRALAPSRQYMQSWIRKNTSWESSRVLNGRFGLLIAYLWRPVLIVVRLPKAVSTVLRAHRSQRRGSGSQA